MAPVIRTNVDLQIEILPSDGIRLPFFLQAATSEHRRFLAARSSRQSAAMYHSRSVTPSSEFASRLGVEPSCSIPAEVSVLIEEPRTFCAVRWSALGP
jgi:hypothetical protein